ncbi:NACHT domain-containing protein [Streptomyces sp. 24-1644]|uniref:NACHT domain-containing protein n=1 Tax=Streptomyces sp. 24-1644 TaxID=3457315 RepID=UPI003FA796AC
MRFDLYRLGSREFENLAQSITVAELGPTVTVFGAGSDGGREATQTMPTTGQYTVLQAKYKEVPAAARAEATWLISELRKEFKEWRESPKREKKPDHFIVATNVSLSATPSTGGIDRVAKVMNDECEKLGISQWTVWHAENISRFLEKHSGIRTAYAAWVLPGDILAALHTGVMQRNVDASQAIKSCLAKELLKDRFANLDQAGSADDRTIPLADVFFDVPIGLSNEHQIGNVRCLETLIAACNVKHSPEEGNMSSQPHLLNASNRYVLVGGPGQGKSTVSQFLCQLYRAQLVKDTTAMRNPEVRAAVSQINAQAEAAFLTPMARRWPVNIPLTRLADELAQGKCKSLLDYIAQRISEVSSTDVLAKDMKQWLQDFPWLLVLDGLDEVPGSSNRAEVLAQISAFQLEADELNADLVVVATTRPQGYTDDFSPKNFQHFVLTPLDRSTALGYGRKLAVARYGDSSDRVQRLVMRLERAADEPSTAHLMATPLQVTIMAVLLDRVGKAPKDRFTLFADYYRVIYERELEKEGAASNLLRDHKTDIDSIHADVGLLLQNRSERSGETGSRLTLQELHSIIEDRLRSEGHDGHRLDELTSAISRAATDRLVFLVPSREDEVSFEIRSLQEFWAADALMNCSEDEIGRRLRIMSVSSHWRNVLLFALGNIFATRRNNLRDSVIALVSELNAHSDIFGNIQRRVLTGSRLAVEILSDGMVRAPRYESTLLEQGLKLLTLPPSKHVSMLAACITDRGMEIAQDYFNTSILNQEIPPPAALVFLGVRTAHDDEWSKNVLVGVIESLSDAQKVSVWALGLTEEVPALLHVSASAILSPEITIPMASNGRIVISHSHNSLLSPAGGLSAPAWLLSIIKLFSLNHSGRSRILIGHLVLTYVSVQSCPAELSDAFSAEFPEDHWLKSIEAFASAPSKEGLARIIEKAGSSAGADYSKVSSAFPWIIHYAFDLYAREGGSAADLIRSGRLGDTSDWLAVEGEWQTASVEYLGGELAGWLTSRDPFIPLPACQVQPLRQRRSASPRSNLNADEALKICLEVRDEDQQSRVASALLPALSANGRTSASPALRQLHTMTLRQPHSFTNFAWVSDMYVDDELLDLLDQMGREAMPGFAWIPQSNHLNLAAAWATDFRREGLGWLFACQGYEMAGSGEAHPEILAEWYRIRDIEPNTSTLKQVFCTVVSMLCVPADEKDAQLRLACFVEAMRSGRVSIALMMGLLNLDHSAPSRALVMGLLDSGILEPYDLQHVYASMVRMQADAPTDIDFSTMRPS